MSGVERRIVAGCGSSLQNWETREAQRTKLGIELLGTLLLRTASVQQAADLKGAKALGNSTPWGVHGGKKPKGVGNEACPTLSNASSTNQKSEPYRCDPCR